MNRENHRTISFHTLGCRLNQSETTALENSCQSKGFTQVPFGTPADIVVINTCTVTQNSDAETRRLVTKISRDNPAVKIALIGCQAQMQKQKLLTLPNVKWVIGNGPKMQALDILTQTWQDRQTHVLTPAIQRDSFSIPLAGMDRTHTRANLKIQDGCDFFCSFCEIPFARGRARSRQFNDLLAEARAMVQAGHKEIILTGINIGTYHDQGRNFMDVIHSLEELPGLERIRISSIEPTTIPTGLIERMAVSTKLCRHLHIPLQSGDDKILQRMKRKYRADEFLDLVEHAQRRVPGLCIGTDVIVGFPGEDDPSFEKTVAFVLAAPLHYLHVFSYSPRSMAASAKLEGAVDPQTIEERSHILRQISERKKRVFSQQFLGEEVDVLWERKTKDHWTGLTSHYLRVKSDSPRDLFNQLTTVRLRGFDGPLLTAEAVL